MGFIDLVILVVVTRHSDEVFARIDHEFLVPNYEGPEIQIAVLADFHFWRPTQLNRLAPLSQALVDADPDYILLLGDYAERSANWNHAAREIVVALNALNRLHPPSLCSETMKITVSRIEWIKL